MIPVDLFQLMYTPIIIITLQPHYNTVIYLEHKFGYNKVEAWLPQPVASPREKWVGPDPLTSVQTPPEICTNPLKSVYI